ncbi:substrate-binding domain-containing protein [Gemmatimonadota bacterium]
MTRAAMVGLGLLAVLCPQTEGAAQSGGRPIRVAVIGGMTETGMWEGVARMFTDRSGYRVELVATGQRPELAEALREGRVDLLTMHSGDITTRLAADGYGENLRAWAMNDLVILGPESDPAGIGGLRDGVEAFRRIAEAEANFVDVQAIGPREVAHSLWQQAGIKPMGAWLLKDECVREREILRWAAQRNAYVIKGRIPVVTEKLAPAPGMRIMVEQDPAMRRPYVVLTANPASFPDANVHGARLLSDFLLSEAVQTFLAHFDGGVGDGVPLFHPVAGT